jgi:hypothetical protein
MALRAVEHVFNGATTQLSIVAYGTVSVSGTLVTGTGTFFIPSLIGMKIGFGSTSIKDITTWYTISSFTSGTSITLSASAGTINVGTKYVVTAYDSTKTNLGSLMIQKSGRNPEDNFAGPFPVIVARPVEESVAVSGMFPHVITFSSTIDWVFLLENVASTGVKRIVLYEYNKVSATYNWKGYIGATLPNTGSHTNRGFRALRYLHTTGTVSVSLPVAVLTGSSGITLALAVGGVVTGVGATGITSAHIGMMVGFGSTDPAQINCWYPITSWTSAIAFSVSGASNIIAASINWVVASCTVTGDSTKFVEEGIAAGTTGTTVAGGLGPRIGFGSTDPTEITQWFQIGRITSDTSINLVNSPGLISANTPYVIEELRFIIITSNATPANGGLFLVKGAGYLDFQTNTIGALVLPAIVTNVDNQRGVYWLSDAGTTVGTNVVTNQAGCGCGIVPEINKGLHYCYVIDGSTNAKVYRYNLRATGTITAGKMLMSINYTTTGTVTVTNGVVAGSGTSFTDSMIGMKIGFNTTSPATVTTWYEIASYTSGTSITLTNLSINTSAGVPYIIDSADVLCTGNVVVAGTLSILNNGRVGTLNHGPGKGEESLYFVTTTRIYRAALSNIYAGNLNWISDNRNEIPPGSVSTFPLTNVLSSVEIIDSVDRLIVLTSGATAFKHYITRYPQVSGDQFDRFFGIDDKQQDQSLSDPNTAIHYSTNSLPSSVWSQNGVSHIVKHSAVAATNQMYALPLGAHWSYSAVTDERIITPAIYTPDCSFYKRMMITAIDHLGSEEFRLPTASILAYYRTKGIVDNTGGWTSLPEDGDLTGLSPSDKIQFMFEFTTIGLLGIPGRIISVAVLYDDFSTDPHFQPSAGKTIVANKQFAWRLSSAFGTTVPTLRVRLFDAVTGGLLVDDNTITVGPWEKASDGITWEDYGTLADKSNETTYIRYTPVTLPDNIKVRALLTLY